MQIMVRDNNVDQALRALKKKLQREGVYREMKLRRHYENRPKSARAKKPLRFAGPQNGPQARRARRQVNPITRRPIWQAGFFLWPNSVGHTACRGYMML